MPAAVRRQHRKPHAVPDETRFVEVAVPRAFAQETNQGVRTPMETVIADIGHATLGGDAVRIVELAIVAISLLGLGAQGPILGSTWIEPTSPSLHENASAIVSSPDPDLPQQPALVRQGSCSPAVRSRLTPTRPDRRVCCSRMDCTGCGTMRQAA